MRDDNHYNKRLRLDRQLNFMFALGIVGLIAIGFFLQKSIDDIKLISNRRAEAKQISFDIQRLVSLITDAETGQRGFLLTGQEAYLQPFSNAMEKIQSQFVHIRKSFAPDSPQLPRIDELRVLTAEKLAELDETIDLVRRNSQAAALNVVLTHRGNEVMTRIRKLVDVISVEQEAQVREYGLQMDLIIRHGSIIMGLATGASVFAVLAILILLNRNQRKRQHAENALQATFIDLKSHEALLSQVIAVQNQIATAPLESRALMDLVVQMSEKLTGCSGSIIEIVEGEELIYHCAAGSARPHLGMRIKREGSFSGLCLERAETLACEDSETDNRVNREACRKVQLRSMIVVPLHHQGKIIGVLKNYSNLPHFFDDRKINALKLITGVLSASLGQAAAFEEKNSLINDLERSKEELIALKDRAESATKAKSRFLASMSHEFRTPLNGILGMTTLLMDESLTVAQAEYATAIRGSGESLLRLVNDALDFSKIESGRLEFEQVDFDIESTMLDLKKSFSYVARQKNLALQLEIESALPLYVRGDPGRLRQILTNLIGNAIKFTPSGAVAIHVANLAQSETDVQLRFEIKDTGIGISDEAAQQLFQEFVQADSSTTRLYGGTGLGLSICKRLVEQMSGQIGVLSAPEKGSTFWFTIRLPLGQKTEVVPNSDKIQAQQHLAMRILIAEDNQFNQVVISKMLEKLGASCNVVGNGKEAIDALQSRPYDLVLMDCNMPEMDGFQATAFIRTSPLIADSHIPIIAMTANALKGDAEECLKAGMDDYVSKPINIKRVTEVLTKWSQILEERKKA